MMPPPEILEQKLAAQHVEMQKLATENHRLAATHGTLRQELAAAQQDLQVLCSRMGTLNAERDQQMKGLVDKIAAMEAELKNSDSLKKDVLKARADAQSLHAERQELVTKAQKLNQDLQRAHVDMQQIPAMMAELDSLRQEYQHYRGTYEYEKKLYNDHLESLQVMEKNYVAMAAELEKVRAELNNSANIDRRISGGVYGNTTGYNENNAAAYNESYATQGRVPPTGATASGAAAAGVPHVVAQSGALPVRPGYNAPVSYDMQRGHMYDPLRAQGGPGYEAQRGHAYDPQRGQPQPHIPPTNATYGSAAPSVRPGNLTRR
jgi:hypothetical protein